MSNSTPYAQLVGAVDVYIAAASTARPDLDDAVAAPWVSLGATDGDQNIENSGALSFYRDNKHTGPVKARRPEEDVKATFTLVEMTQETYARILHNVSKVTSGTSGAVASKRMPLKRGPSPTEYALLLRGASDSPYGDFPGQVYLPRVVSDAEPMVTRGKDSRAQIECNFVALEDDTQTTGDELGIWEVQAS